MVSNIFIKILLNFFILFEILLKFCSLNRKNELVKCSWFGSCDLGLNKFGQLGYFWGGNVNASFNLFNFDQFQVFRKISVFIYSDGVTWSLCSKTFPLSCIVHISLCLFIPMTSIPLMQRSSNSVGSTKRYFLANIKRNIFN